MKELSGQEMMDLLEEQIAAHAGGINKALRRLDASSATFAWLDTYRAIEEFINLPFTGDMDDPLYQSIFSLQLAALMIDPRPLRELKRGLSKRFSSSVADRFIQTVIQATAIGEAFRKNGLIEAASGFQTVAHAIRYFQSRRRHMVAFLYTIPQACNGIETVERLDSLNLFLPLIETSGVTLTGLHIQAMLADVHADHSVLVDAHGFSGNHVFNPLDSFFLDPERASMVEMLDQKVFSQLGQINTEPVDPSKIFSTAELRNAILQMEAAYSEFGLASSAFAPMAKLVRAFIEFCQDDYTISLSGDQFEKVIVQNGASKQQQRLLVHRGDDYVKNTNVFSPFVEVSGAYISTVTLLQRFLYYWKNVCLNKVKRFQIRSGFIFEEGVKCALQKQGFLITGVKRINRKEFDVVAVLDDVIYNVQCKNNLVDLSRIEPDRKRYARYNRQLDQYYAKALSKEKAREQLLRDELYLKEVRHFVVSRFPIATTNLRVISFSKIDDFRSLSNA